MYTENNARIVADHMGTNSVLEKRAFVHHAKAQNSRNRRTMRVFDSPVVMFAKK